MDAVRRLDPTALYRLFDANDLLLYIGVTVNQKARWSNHAREKMWWPQVARIEIEWHDSRIEALLAEKAAIEAETPLHNTVHHPVNEPAFREQCQRDALRWARGRDHEPYPDGLEWPDVVGDLGLEQVLAAITLLHVSGVKTPAPLARRRTELIRAIERELERGAA